MNFTLWSTLVMKSESRSVMSNSLRPHGLYSPWNSLGQNTGVGSHSLLQGIFPNQGSNPGLIKSAFQADSLPTELTYQPIIVSSYLLFKIWLQHRKKFSFFPYINGKWATRDLKAISNKSVITEVHLGIQIPIRFFFLEISCQCNHFSSQWRWLDILREFSFTD